MDEEDAIGTASRRASSSGGVDHSNTVVLHETSRTKISAVVFFIDRSAGTEIALKLEVRTKSKEGWVFIKEREINLKDEAVRKLHHELGVHLATAEQGSRGDSIA